MSRNALRVAYIWRDEVMQDLVFQKPRPVTLGARYVRRIPWLFSLRLLAAGLVLPLVNRPDLLPVGVTIAASVLIFFVIWSRVVARWRASGDPTMLVPDLGLPDHFPIVAPGKTGYVLTLGERMRGTICVGGQQQDVAKLVRREAARGFCATPIGKGDWGVIELDESGVYKLFFQFVGIDEPTQFLTPQVMVGGGVGYAASSIALVILWYRNGIPLGEALLRGVGIASVAMVMGALVWSMIRQDGESQASLAFSVVLHAALLFMTYQLYDGENPFVWPGPRSLTGNYLVTRLDKEEPPEPKPPPAVATKQPQAPAAAAPTKQPPKKTATKGDEGQAGGKGDTERARDPNAKDVPPEPPKVQFFEDKNRKILDNIIDRNLATNLSKFAGIKGDRLTKGSMGFGPGKGTGVGAGIGTGTRTGSKKGGNGGGGNVEGDFVTGPGKIDTGTNRPGGGNCVGTSCGTGPKAIKVGFSQPSGDFGGLTAEEIDRVVKARAGVFRACYQKELNHTPGIGGKLVIHFKIGGDGTVQAGNTATASGSTMRNDTVEQCVKSNVNRLKFPAKGGVANVNYPFVFTQGG